jgi:hypothetical protein
MWDWGVAIEEGDVPLSVEVSTSGFEVGLTLGTMALTGRDMYACNR